MQPTFTITVQENAQPKARLAVRLFFAILCSQFFYNSEFDRKIQIYITFDKNTEVRNLIECNLNFI